MSRKCAIIYLAARPTGEISIALKSQRSDIVVDFNSLNAKVVVQYDPGESSPGHFFYYYLIWEATHRGRQLCR